jgi:thioredoxin-like negative regulator of GroEL
MASPNREELMAMAVTTFKQGNRESARVMFRQVIQDDPRNERALLYMAKLANAPTERKLWLQKVLEVNPDNETAQAALGKLEASAEESENRKLVTYSGLVGGALLLSILAYTAVWALRPLG